MTETPRGFRFDGPELRERDEIVTDGYLSEWLELHVSLRAYLRASQALAAQALDRRNAARDRGENDAAAAAGFQAVSAQNIAQGLGALVELAGAVLKTGLREEPEKAIAHVPRRAGGVRQRLAP